jgi:hypothetical protein
MGKHKIDLTEIDGDDVDWAELAYDRVQRHAFVNTMMNNFEKHKLLKA